MSDIASALVAEIRLNVAALNNQELQRVFAITQANQRDTAYYRLEVDVMRDELIKRGLLPTGEIDGHDNI